MTLSSTRPSAWTSSGWTATELVEIGVTDYITIPWIFDGLGFDAPLDKKQDSLKRFADTYIHSGWQDT